MNHRILKAHPVLRAAAIALVSSQVTACSSDLTTTPNDPPVDTGALPPAASVEITPSTVNHPFSLDTITLKAAALYADGYEIRGKQFAWSSSDTAVLVVDSSGRVITRSQGTAHVVAAVDGVSDTALLTIDPGIPFLNGCLSCHWENNQDHHLAWGFDAATCDACHAVNDEPHATLRSGHPGASNGFDLMGAHGSRPCAGCHVVGDTTLRYSPVDAYDCVACHQADYDVQHSSSNYPTSCLSCHTVDAWAGTTFDHDTGGFSLLGAHADLVCTACHDATTFAPLYTPTSNTDCIACHQTDYDAQHAGSDYPTDCLGCHTTDGWTGATFDHATNSGGFTLQGIHADLVCTSCHDATTFAPLYAPANDGDCIACHQQDYDSEHAAAGYPTTCVSCHTTDTWTGNTFDHDADYFPIFSSEHSSRWTVCGNCHTNIDDFSQFTCFNCHAHDPTPMNQKHSGISGYSYQSTSCYGCHPNGKAP